jgi:hypothetical protein
MGIACRPRSAYTPARRRWTGKRALERTGQSAGREPGKRGVAVHVLDAFAGMASWEAIVALTSSTELADDPDFETLAVASLEDPFSRPVQAEGDTDALTVIFGLGRPCLAMTSCGISTNPSGMPRRP